MLHYSMNTMNRYYQVAFLLCMGVNAWSQNINYSQYKDAPNFTNPALIAASSDINFSVMHRSQTLTESLKYNTTSALFTMPLLNAKKTKRWGGWGLSVLNDEVKGGLAFRTQGITALYAYNLPIAIRQYIGFGMQVGYFQRNVSMGGLATSNQWVNNVGYVPSMGTGETLVDGSKGYLNLSAGFLYYKEDQVGRQTARFGVAAFNVNQPDVSFTNSRDIIPLKVTAHGNLALVELQHILIQGEALYYRENNKNTFHLGARASYYFDPSNPAKGSVDLKAGYRVNNAITTEVQLHQPNFTIGFAYDFGVYSKESYRRPNDVPEFLFSYKKFIGKKTPKTKKAESYTSMGTVRDFYFNEKKSKPSGKVLEDVKNHFDEADTSTVNKGVFKLKHDFKFGFNESTLNEESKAYLDDMVTLLQGNENVHLEVIGHTDNVGSSSANKNVSMRRAQVVVDYLVEKGIDPAKLAAIGRSDKEPLLKNDSEAAKALNRRVEFVIYNR
jgi:type IX secretion system PorP/SprF family membrane protein